MAQGDKPVSNEGLIHFIGWANKAAETFNDLLKVRQKVRRRTHFIPNYSKSGATFLFIWHSSSSCAYLILFLMESLS